MKSSDIKYVLTLSAITCITTSVHAQNQSSENMPVSFEGSYVVDNVNNINGGIKPGSCYLGKANIMLGFDTKNARLWNDGQLCINAVNTNGSRASKYFIRDVQVVSNIEAGNHTYMQYIINPASTGKALPNAFAANFRFGFSF